MIIARQYPNQAMVYFKLVKRGLRGRPAIFKLSKEENNNVSKKKEIKLKETKIQPLSLVVNVDNEENFQLQSIGGKAWRNEEEGEEGRTTAKSVVNRLRKEKNKDKKNEFNIGGREKTKNMKFDYPYPGLLNFKLFSKVEVAKELRKNMIYCNNNIVILNKPYGISVHGGDKQENSIKSCLPYLSKMIYGYNSEIPLKLCNRLDNMTTGILICTANEKYTDKIIVPFREGKVLRKFWSICHGNTEYDTGVIDIPLREKQFDGDKLSKKHSRIAISPYTRMDEDSGAIVKVRPYKSRPATTWYRVLDYHKKLSLIELQPLTNEKHQLRVHLASGLGCTILGDHKYSHTNCLAPQKLPAVITKTLRIEQSKTRNLPMHLHFREVIIPNVFNNPKKAHLHIVAKYSQHFFNTIKTFKLRPGKPTEWHQFKEANWYPNKPKEEESPLFIDPTVPAEVEEDETWSTLAENSFQIFSQQKSRATFKS